MYSEEIKALVKFIYSKLVNESKKGSVSCSLKKPLERASHLTGISRTTVFKWIQERDGSTTKRKNEKPRQPFKKLDSFDTELIGRKIKDMLSSGENITTKKVQGRLLDDHQLNVPKTTLWRVMKLKGFTFRKTDGNRKILCERLDLQVARCAYLRKIKETRKSFNIVYLDETWVNANHTYPKEWVSVDGKVGRKIPTGKGQRLILLHAVDEKTGFLPDCQLLFKSHSTDGRDYHTEMNSTVFEDWVEHKLLPALT